MDPNLYIDDDYVTKVGKDCQDCGNNLEDDLDAFLSILQGIEDKAIVSGTVHDAVTDYRSVVASIKGQLSAISKEADTTCTSLINQIDSDDQWVY